MIPTYERQPTNTNVQYGSSASLIGQSASSIERLQSRLQGGRQAVEQEAQQDITDETVEQALTDVKEGKIDSESVARVAKNVYRNTANKAFLADVELSGSELGSKIRTAQQGRGNYNVASFDKAWAAHSKSTLTGINDVLIRENTETMLARQGSRFSTQILALQTSQQRARHSASLQAKLASDKEALKEAIGVAPEEAIRLQGEIEGTLRSMHGANFIVGGKADQLRKGIGKEVYLELKQKEFKQAMFAGKGEEFITKWDKSNQPALDEQEQLKVSRSFNGQMSKQRRQARAANSSLVKENTMMIDEGIDILDSGHTPPNEIVLDAIITTLPAKKQKEYQISKVVNSTMDMFSDKTLPEMKAYINSGEAKEIVDIYGVEVLDAAKKVLSEKTKFAEQDPISLGVQDGLIPEGEIVTKDSLEAIPERLKQSVVTSEQYGSKPKLLTVSEADGMASFMSDSTVTIGEKVGLLAKINSYGTEPSELIYNQIGGKKQYNFAFAGEMSASGNMDAAGLALQGNGADVKLEEDITIKVQAQLKGVFNNYTSEYYNQNIKGVKDVIKGMIVRGQNVVVKDVIENTLGKSVEYNNKQTIIPYGVEEQDFELWLDNISIPNRENLTENLQDMTDTLFSGDTQLHYYAPGQYMIWNNNDGNGFYEMDTDDTTKPMILKWGK